MLVKESTKESTMITVSARKMIWAVLGLGDFLVRGLAFGISSLTYSKSGEIGCDGSSSGYGGKCGCTGLAQDTSAIFNRAAL